MPGAALVIAGEKTTPTVSPTPGPSRLVLNQQPDASQPTFWDTIPLAVIILAALLIVTSCLLICIGLRAICGNHKTNPAHRSARRDMEAGPPTDPDDLLVEHSVPLTRAGKKKAASKRRYPEVSETDDLSSVSSFHPSEYSSSSTGDDDDDQYTLYSIISGVSSAGVSQVSPAFIAQKPQKLSAANR